MFGSVRKFLHQSITRFKHHNLDKLNWSYLDAELQTRTSLVLFREEMKCFSTRFLLVPDSTETSSQVLAKQRGDIYTDYDFKAYEGRFVRFIEMAVNKMKSGPNLRGMASFIPPGNTSPDSAGSIRRKTASAPQSIGRMRSIDNSSSADLNSAIDAWLIHLKQNPISMMIAKKSVQLPSTLFVSYDLIDWLQTRAPAIQTKKEAINFANRLLQNRRIRLLPRNIEEDETGSTISYESDETFFRYGFYLYLVVTPTIDSDTFFMEDKTRVLVDISDFCSSDEFANCHFSSKTVPLELTNTCFNIRNVESKFTEWCRIYYEKSYNPRKAYEIWIKWLMATSQAVSDLVLKQWGRNAKKFEFEFLPVPEDAFAEPTNYLSSPLRSPIFVNFNANELPEDQV